MHIRYPLQGPKDNGWTDRQADGHMDRHESSIPPTPPPPPTPTPTTHKPCEGLQTQFVGAHKFVAGAIITI